MVVPLENSIIENKCRIQFFVYLLCCQNGISTSASALNSAQHMNKKKTHQPLVYIYLKPLLSIQYYTAGIVEIESDKQKERDESTEERKKATLDKR